jgi:glycosyltransferase involved in cell wall biosynthesis
MSNICLVTTEYPGATVSGGIGSYIKHLCELLQESHTISVLIVAENINPARIPRIGNIDFISINQLPARAHSGGTSPLYKDSLTIMDWLKTQDFDHINFPDWKGLAFATLQAKKVGNHFQDTVISVTLHGISMWANPNSIPSIGFDVQQEKQHYFETFSIENSDIVLSPSDYMKNWISRMGFATLAPIQTIKNPYVEKYLSSTRVVENPNSRIIFFGRLEKRKGVELFLTSLLNLNNSKSVELLFIGRKLLGYDPINEELIRERFKSLTFFDDLDTESALELCKVSGTLVVVPSLFENCPYVVQELASHRVKLLASNVGGIPELIDSANLFEPTVKHLSLSLQRFIDDSKSIPACTAKDPSHSQNRMWLEFFDNKVEKQTKNKVELPITIIVAHFNQARFLKESLDSIRSLDYSNFHVIVIDDGSSPEETREFDLISRSFNYSNFKFIRQKNSDVGFTRNRGVRESQTDHICFFDADDVLRPDTLKLFNSAFLRGADVVTTHFSLFLDHAGLPKTDKGFYGSYEPIGAALKILWKENVLGGANFAARKEIFWDLGGFNETRGSNHQDWQFLTKAALAQCNLVVIPERLLNYRVVEKSMARSRSNLKGNLEVLNVYVENAPITLLRQLAGIFLTADVMSLDAAMNQNFNSATNRLAQKLRLIANRVTPYGSRRWKILVPLYRWLIR